jgi:hypothetical protein
MAKAGLDKKITKTTLKNFIKDNEGNLYVKLKGEYGEKYDFNFKKVLETSYDYSNGNIYVRIGKKKVIAINHCDYKLYNYGGYTGIRFTHEYYTGVMAIKKPLAKP